MTPEEQRLALITGACPECGHGILTHKNGLCRVVIRTRLWGMVECNCTAIQPPSSNSQRILEFK